MPRQKEDPAAFAAVTVRGRRCEILPHLAFGYAAAAVLVLLALLIVFEYTVFRRLERDRMLPTPEWAAETKRINANTVGKVLTRPVWSSSGLPVSPRKTRLVRIAVMGDSFTWGAALANINDVWWRQLERELHERGYRDVEVIAAAAQGASTREQLAFAKTVVARYSPDLLIWGYVTNDPDEELVPRVPTPTHVEPLFDAATMYMDPILPITAFRLRELRNQKKLVLASSASSGYEYFLWELEILRGPNLEAYRRTLREVRAFVTATGLPSFFITLPNYATGDGFRRRYNPILPEFRRAGLPMHDILPRFVKEYGHLPLLRFAATPTDTHPGPMVTRYFAVQAADILERDYRAFLGNRTKPGAVANAVHFNDWAPYHMRVSPRAGGAEIVYPERDDDFLRMPRRTPYVQLNLERPVRARAIAIEGADLREATLAITGIGPDGYDDRAELVLEPCRKAPCRWDVRNMALAERLHSIRIQARFDAGASRVCRVIVQ